MSARIERQLAGNSLGADDEEQQQPAEENRKHPLPSDPEADRGLAQPDDVGSDDRASKTAEATDDGADECEEKCCKAAARGDEVDRPEDRTRESGEAATDGNDEREDESGVDAGDLGALTVVRDCAYLHAERRFCEEDCEHEKDTESESDAENALSGCDEAAGELDCASDDRGELDVAG